MHVYIDETGDCGFKFNENSSKIFSITCIIFRDNKQIESVANSIKKLNERLKNNLEWHFTKTRPERRIEFLKTIKPYDFSIGSVVMNKQKLCDKNLANDSKLFYRHTCKLLLQCSLEVFQSAKLIFDKCGNKDFYKDLRKYIRKDLNVNYSVIKEFKAVDSHKEIPLQIADMVAGSIGRSYMDKPDKNDYIDILKNKIEFKYEFPEDYILDKFSMLTGLSLIT